MDWFASKGLPFNFLKYFHLNILLRGRKVTGTFGKHFITLSVVG